MDIFPSKRTEKLVAVHHSRKWEPFEALMLGGRVLAFITFMEHKFKRVFYHPLENWIQNPLRVENFKRTLTECQIVNFFDADLHWSKVDKKLNANPTKEKKYSDQRLIFQMDNMLLVKQLFTFGLTKVSSEDGHVYQTSDAPMLIYHLTENGLKITPKPNTNRRSFVKQDQASYDRYVLRPHNIYVVPPMTQYLVITVQKTLFAVDVMAWDACKHYYDFRLHKNYLSYNFTLPPLSPIHEMETPHMVTPDERLSLKRVRNKFLPSSSRRLDHCYERKQTSDRDAVTRRRISHTITSSDRWEIGKFVNENPKVIPPKLSETDAGFDEPQQQSWNPVFAPPSDPERMFPKSSIPEPVCMDREPLAQKPNFAKSSIPGPLFINNSFQQSASEQIYTNRQQSVQESNFASQQQPLFVPQPENGQDAIFVFHEPMDTSNDLTLGFENGISPETIQNFLANFEKEISGVPTVVTTRPAHQIQLDRQNVHRPKSVCAKLPPPPDNYWGENTTSSSSLEEKGADIVLDMEVEDEPLNMTTIHPRVAIPQKTHVFVPKQAGALDLSNKI